MTESPTPIGELLAEALKPFAELWDQLDEDERVRRAWRVNVKGVTTDAIRKARSALEAWNRRPLPGGVEGETSQSQPCGEASADAEVFAGRSAERSAVREALEAAYTFISQPQRMSTPKGGPQTATYRIENYNALTAQIRKALGR